MKFTTLTLFLMITYSVVSIATFMLAQTLSGRNIWDDPYWRYVPDGLRQMMHAKDTEKVTNQWKANGEKKPPPISHNAPGRFPVYGTPEFLEQCNWTKTTEYHGPDCTFLVRPKKDEKEGLSLWVSQIVEGYILSRQAGCYLKFDYGGDVDIHQVLTPAPDLGTAPGDLQNWTVPEGFSCTRDNLCFTVPAYTGSCANLSFTESIPGRRTLASVPFYRFALWGAGASGFYENMFQDLEQTLPGFQIESGMACSLGMLFHLAPSAAQIEPRLFTDLLPKLHDEDTLVISIYIRTSQTEKGVNASENTKQHLRVANGYIQRAFSIEEDYLTGIIQHKRDIRRIVWMVVTDSQSLKEWAADTYGGEDANAKVPADKRKWPSPVQREVLFTDSRGAHTRAHGSPSTVDFAEAFVDWYLIGESDLVIVGAYTFGHTGSLRTARPVYNLLGKVKLVRSGEPPVGRQVQVKVARGGGPVKFKPG